MTYLDPKRLAKIEAFQGQIEGDRFILIANVLVEQELGVDELLIPSKTSNMSSEVGVCSKSLFFLLLASF